jgi:hypothetical protein
MIELMIYIDFVFYSTTIVIMYGYHGTYTCFLIISSLVLIYFLSFQMHRHLNMAIVRSPYRKVKIIVREYRWRLRSKLKRPEIIFLKFLTISIERVLDAFGGKKHLHGKPLMISKNWLRHKKWTGPKHLNLLTSANNP